MSFVEVALAGGGAIMLVGALFAYRKGKHFAAQTARITETEVSAVADVRSGPVAIEGTARRDGRPLTAALSGEDALVTQSSVVAKKAGGADGTSSTKTLHRDERAVPFVVDDESGSIRVEPPDEADVRLDQNRARGRDPAAADLAQNPENAAAGTVDLELPRFSGNRIRYKQGVVVPGDDVYVYGEAVGGGSEIRGGENPEHFVVSDLSKDTVAQGGKWGAYLLYAATAVMAILGVMLLFGGLL